MESGTQKWFFFLILSVIWGSSFWLIEAGMTAFTPFQVASLRIVFAAFILLPIALKHLFQYDRGTLFYIFMTGVLGNLLPAYLFCLAETKIESSLAGTLNALTPIFTIITGALFWKIKTSSNKIIGILMAFTGSFGLFLSRPEISMSKHYSYLMFIIAATFCYGLNVNLVRNKLAAISPLRVVALALLLNAIPAVIILFFTGFFHQSWGSVIWIQSISATFILGAIGTSVANVLFYMLIKKAGAVFASLVTYGIPFVALIWGLWDHEPVGWGHVMSLFLILFGVFYASRNQELNKKST